MARSDLRAKIRLEGDASGATKAIKQTESGFKRLGSRLRSGAIAATAALASLVGAFKLLEAAGERLGQKRSLERTLEAQGDTVKRFIGELRDLSNAQIATSDLILSSNRALALGIAKDDIPGLLEAATKASVSLGISATQAFNDITTGVGRASPLILDNLGIVVDAVRVYKDFAENIGLTAEELTKQQKTAALSAAVMENAAKGAADFADAQSKVTVALAQSQTKLKEWFETTVDVIAKNEALAQSIENVSSAASEYSAAARGMIRDFKDLLPVQEESEKRWEGMDGVLHSLPLGVSNFTKVLREYGKTVIDTEKEQEAFRQSLIEIDAMWLRLRGGVEGLTDSQIAYNDAIQEGHDRTKRIEAGLLAEATALDKLRAAIGEVTQAELQKELDEITTALEKARIETGGNTAAFLEMEAKVVPAIDHMKARIKGLATGLGDIGEAAVDAGEQIDDLSDATDRVAASTRVATSELERESAQANRTAASLRTLTAVEESLALARTRTALRQTQRARGVRGSSGSSGIGSSGLSPFGTGGLLKKVDADGILEPA